MNPKKIIVVGSANMDMIMRVERLPKPGETLLGNGFMTAHGGKGANQAVAAARLGAKTTFVGSIGNDAFGQMQREGLAREGINLDCLKTQDQMPTGAAMILITESGQNSIVVAPAANYGILPADIEGMRQHFETADVVLCQLEIPLETVAAVLHMTRGCGVFSILDAGPAQPVDPEILACADLVSPNETEAEMLTGIAVDSLEKAHDAARCLREQGVNHVVLKMGSRGCLYLGEDALYMPAYPIEAVDTTAAGDAFTAALAAAWDTVALPDALKFANAAGALAATRQGAQPSMPALAEVNAFLNKQGEPGV